MFPIGILTKNRAVYLDATLKSLSGSHAPGDLRVTVFDDGSDDPDARRYIDTGETFKLRNPLQWPSTHEIWIEKGLGFLPFVDQLSGIRDRVNVQRASVSLGVVNASNWAVRTLFHEHPQADYVCLLQDDIVFTEDWYSRLGTVLSEETGSERPALVSGCIISYTGWAKVFSCDEASFTTAQCLAISRQMWSELALFHATSQRRVQYDESLSYGARKAGYRLRVVRPACVQHIGVDSQVWPDGEVFLDGVGRLCHYVSPPYAWCDEVANFCGP